jgi:hypothetical protein
MLGLAQIFSVVLSTVILVLKVNNLYKDSYFKIERGINNGENSSVFFSVGY